MRCPSLPVVINLQHVTIGLVCRRSLPVLNIVYPCSSLPVIKEAAHVVISVVLLLATLNHVVFGGSYSVVVCVSLALPCPGGSYSVVVSAVLVLPSPGALLSHVREAAIPLLSV